MLNEEPKYVITDGQKYYKIDKKTNEQDVTTNICSAKVFDTYDKADLVIKTMKKTIRMFDWKVKLYTECGDPVATISINDCFNDDFEIKVKNIETFSKELMKEKQLLESELNTMEQEIIDIEHAAEFYNLNASQGYKIYKMLHDARNKRRKCQNKLAKISYVLDGTFQDCLEDRISRRMEGLKHREYTPKVLNELFNV